MYSVIFSLYVIKMYKEWIINEVRKIDSSFIDWKSLLMLNDKKHFAACSKEKNIKIYDISNNCKCEKEIVKQSEIFSICQLENGEILSSCDKPFFKDPKRDCLVCKIILLPDNRIVTSSYDFIIRVWDIEKSDPIKELIGHERYVESLLYIKEKNILISGSVDSTMRLWSMSSYQCISIIDEVYCCSTNALYRVDDNRVIAGFNRGLILVNFDKCVIEYRIRKNIEIGMVLCFMKLKDNKTILCGCEHGHFCLFDIETKKYKVIQTNYNEDILDLLYIGDNHFVTCEKEGIIEWEFEEIKKEKRFCLII